MKSLPFWHFPSTCHSQTMYLTCSISSSIAVLIYLLYRIRRIVQCFAESSGQAGKYFISLIDKPGKFAERVQGLWYLGFGPSALQLAYTRVSFSFLKVHRHQVLIPDQGPRRLIYVTHSVE